MTVLVKANTKTTVKVVGDSLVATRFKLCEWGKDRLPENEAPKIVIVEIEAWGDFGIPISKIRQWRDDGVQCVALMSPLSEDVTKAKNIFDDVFALPVNALELQSFLHTESQKYELKNASETTFVMREMVNSPYYGTSPQAQKVIEYARIAAGNDHCILIQGETGTGKGMLANWMHQHSKRKNKPFMEINCATLKGSLLRSELYGHVRGAFTSALEDKIGIVERADGGTLFLDEIGDMDLEAQTQFLKTLEDKTFRRIGETKTRKSDFRIICATNRSLSDEVRRGNFRSDLFFRIHVFPINLPTLRDRRSELPAIVEHLALCLNQTNLKFEDGAIEILSQHQWPGNFRELRNVIERAMMFAQGGGIQLSHISFDSASQAGDEVARNNSKETNYLGLSDSTSISFSEPLNGNSTNHSVTNFNSRLNEMNADANEQNLTLEYAEFRHIMMVMKRFNDDKEAACKALGISLASLYRRLSKFRETSAGIEMLTV